MVFRFTMTVPTSRLVASNGVGQRGWITFSKYLSTGTARCTRAARCRVGKGRAAMPCGKTGAGWPTIIWNAGIMRRRPATIETPGAIATRASRSMMMPKERLCRLPISQPRVKWSVGASSCSRCSTTEVGIRTLACVGGVGFSFSLGSSRSDRPAVLTYLKVRAVSWR